eukprot:scaffold79194_cov31-Tisochrysis_lutea.AAC.5
MGVEVSDSPPPAPSPSEAAKSTTADIASAGGNPPAEVPAEAFAMGATASHWACDCDSTSGVASQSVASYSRVAPSAVTVIRKGCPRRHSASSTPASPAAPVSVASESLACPVGAAISPKVGEKDMALTGDECRSTATGTPRLSVHTRTVASREEETTCLLLGETSTSVTSAAWPRSVRCNSPLVTHQTLMFPSSAPVRMRRPVASNRTQYAAQRCPRKAVIARVRPPLPSSSAG